MSGKPFALGLRAQIVISLALVMAVFILLTGLSISELIWATMSKLPGNAAQAVSPAEQASFERTLNNLRNLTLFYMIFGAAVALLIGSYAVTRLVLTPLAQVTKAVEQVSSGKLETQVPIKGTGEIMRLGVAFNRMTATLKEQRIELKQRLEKLEESSADLKKVQGRLIRAAKLASVGTLAAGVAHEIGNPIAGILGLIDVLEHETDEASMRRYLSLMKQEIIRVDRTISDLLAYARPTARDDTKDVTSSTTVEEVFEHVTALLSAQKLFSKVDIKSNFEGGPWKVALSRDDLLQLFVNLFLNSAQAMEGRGQINISVVRIADWRSGLGGVAREAVAIAFEDNGPGVSPEDAPRIFDPFFSKRTIGTGTGLGLAICMSICERAGGEIILDQSHTNGSRFVVTLLGR